jgi:hypothetical protein
MTFAKNLRIMIQQSFLSLPLLLIGWSLFLGSLQGNIGLLVLFLGHLTAVPLTVLLSNTVLEFIVKKLEQFSSSSLMSFIQVNNSDICNLVPGKVESSTAFLSVAPSLWMGHIIFFFSFLLFNGYGVYTMKAADTADPEKVERRKTQALVSMILTSLILLVLVLLRKFAVGCETWIGIFIASTLMPLLGYGWYRLAKECSARDADIFGIVQKILPDEAQQPPPMTCVYTGKA